jgi:hypothetical protein
MLESVVELLFCLCFSALILLVGACILGSIYAALRAVSRGRDYQGEDVKQVFGVGADLTFSEYGRGNLPYRSPTFWANALP